MFVQEDCELFKGISDTIKNILECDRTSCVESFCVISETYLLDLVMCEGVSNKLRQLYEI